MPLLICGWGIYDMSNIEVDSPPPGFLLEGGLLLLAIVTPSTLLTGFRVARGQPAKNQR